MAPRDTIPPAQRASDADREQVIHRLQDGSVEGRLSQDTFLHRLDQALRARRAGELAKLITDLPTADDRGFLSRAVARCSDATAVLRSTWHGPRLPVLVLPRSDRTIFSIGRCPDCDLALADITVSWRHAELRPDGGDWLLTDLGSTNGTRVNGWRVRAPFALRAGDLVKFGGASFRVAERV
jgi:hypothetical protein